MILLNRFIYVVLAWFVLSGVAWADDCENGFNAYRVHKDYFEAFRHLKPCAEAGNIRAQWLVGLMYYRGEGTLESNKESMRWMLMTAESGDAEYQHMVAYQYEVGFNSFPEDPIRAYMWYNLAAAQGHEISRKSMESMRRRELFYTITSAQIEKAQELSVRCLEQNYKDC